MVSLVSVALCPFSVFLRFFILPRVICRFLLLNFTVSVFELLDNGRLVLHVMFLPVFAVAAVLDDEDRLSPWAHIVKDLVLFTPVCSTRSPFLNVSPPRVSGAPSCPIRLVTVALGFEFRAGFLWRSPLLPLCCSPLVPESSSLLPSLPLS